MPVLQTGTQLWVDKYAPRTFVDLLSPEVREFQLCLLCVMDTRVAQPINREVLTWLKSWDKVRTGALDELELIRLLRSLCSAKRRK